MDSLDFELSPTNKKTSPRKGRRAGGLDVEAGIGLDDIGGSTSPTKSIPTTPKDVTGLGPPMGRRAGGWANSARTGDLRQPFEDKRLQRDRDTDSDTDIPVIPDLDEVVEEDFTQQVANAPSVAVNRVATYKELDSDLLRHAAFSTLDDIDLRLLVSTLASESDVREPDIGWRWELLFTEVASELRNEWDPSDNTSENEPMP
ncbi:hypothetical protein Pmani_033669 [Petrolisthes manimaculis]|uniref:Intraflagellar transport protein 43 homolog n=1 Tax=Petrolisthes manimaculis TaxID=1843537 RepID=A0AAE1NQG8_9EUCA|nr:hypothetical protein Pmani_033669 [Petrolisthes manimaculis]